MSFSNNLISLRKQAGLSQEQLGDEIGVSRQAVSKWESGSTTPELDKLMSLGDFFGVTLDQLVGRDPAIPYAASNRDAEQTIEFHPTGRWGFRYEYRSKRKLFGLPLVHINICDKGFCRAKGILAIGNIATGLVSVGAVAAGIFSLGEFSAGLISLGAFAAGLLGVGAISIGLVALGGIAIGIISIGGIAIGMYAVGGCAIGARAAVGDYARAPIIFETKQQFQQAISEHFPNTPHWLLTLLSWFGAY